MADQVTLFGTWASPYSRRVEMALKLKGLQYEFVEEDLHNKSALLLQYNPIHKKIPVLVHNGKVIVESLIILEYIDDTWPNNPILPTHPHGRAMARFWAKFIDETLMTTSWNAKLKENREEATKEFRGQMSKLEGELKGKDFFGGDNIGYVDIVGNTVAFWLPMYEEAMGIELVTAERFPKLNEWKEKLMRVEVVVQCLPPREEHAEYMKKRMAASDSQ